jgi:hypothetical protein
LTGRQAAERWGDQRLQGSFFTVSTSLSGMTTMLPLLKEKSQKILNEVYFIGIYLHIYVQCTYVNIYICTFDTETAVKTDGVTDPKIREEYRICRLIFPF